MCGGGFVRCHVIGFSVVLGVFWDWSGRPRSVLHQLNAIPVRVRDMGQRVFLTSLSGHNRQLTGGAQDRDVVRFQESLERISIINTKRDVPKGCAMIVAVVFPVMGQLTKVSVRRSP